MHTCYSRMKASLLVKTFLIRITVMCEYLSIRTIHAFMRIRSASQLMFGLELWVTIWSAHALCQANWTAEHISHLYNRYYQNNFNQFHSDEDLLARIAVSASDASERWRCIKKCAARYISIVTLALPQAVALSSFCNFPTYAVNKII